MYEQRTTHNTTPKGVNILDLVHFILTWLSFANQNCENNITYNKYIGILYAS